MKLNLKNFKSHQDLSIEIPDTGLIRFEGPSGCGKSTIILAIKVALLGNERGIKSWGKKGTKTSIELLGFQGMDIVRTNTPNTLTVRYQNQEFKDDAAQGVINQVMGMDDREFMVSSYVQQEGKNSILNVDPKEQATIIQNLISKDGEIDLFRDKVSEKIKAEELKLAAAQSEHNVLSEICAKIHGEMNRGQPWDTRVLNLREPTVPEGYCSQVGRDQLERKIKVVSDRYNEAIKAAASIESYQATLARKTMELGSLESKRLEEPASSGPPWQNISKVDTEALQKKYIAKAEYIDRFDRLILLVQRVHERIPESKEIQGKITAFLQERSNLKAVELKELTVLLSELSKEKIDLETWDKDSLECPSCSVALKNYDKKLVEAKVKPDDFQERVLEIAKKFEDVKSKSDKLVQEIEFIDHVINESARLKESLGPDPLPEIKTSTELDDKVNHINEYVTTQNSLEKTFNESKERFAEFDIKIKMLTTDITETESKIKLIKDQHNEDAANFDYSGLQKNLDDSKKYDFDKKLYDMEAQEIKRLSTSYDESRDKLKMVDLEGTQSKLGALERIKEQAGFAAASAMDHKIQEMNNSAEEHVDRMFEDDGTVIKLISTRVTGKGEERAKMGVELFHKGEAVEKFNEFSGGEKSRGCLAYQLGLGDLYSSPILMVDEGLPGLPPEKKELCLEILREASENRLILVVEHGIRNSFFDEVITL